jgi:hypothetical protein
VADVVAARRAADDDRADPMRVQMVAGPLRIVERDEDQGILPLRTSRETGDDLPDARSLSATKLSGV